MRATVRCLMPLLVAALAIGCDGERGRESASAGDSTLFGDDRARQGDTVRMAPDVALLEHLIDEYEQLDVVMDELAGSAGQGHVQRRAWKGDRHEDADKKRLLELLKSEFGERYQARTPEGTARRTDQIAALPPEAGTRALNAMVLDHHRRVQAAIRAGLPSLERPRVREAVTSLQQHLDDEIKGLAHDSAASAGG